MNATTRNLTLLVSGILLVLVLVPLHSGLAQNGAMVTPVAGTLVPPTLVPVTTTPPAPLAVANISGIATLQQENILRVGALYNAPPFVWLDENGRLSGYEADIIRAVAEEIGVEVEFVQVTGETALRMLLTGEVDVLIGQQVHSKQAEEWLEFSYTYYYNTQNMVVREADFTTYLTLASLANHRIGIVAGSRGEEALNIWMARNGLGFQLVRYLSQDNALDALATGEVDGMVGELDDLKRAGRLQMSLIGEPVQLEPYAIALRRYDVNLRNLINRSLQRLLASGTIPTLGAKWFPDETINYAAFIPLYTGLNADDRTYQDFPPDVPIPSRSILHKIRAGETLVVAGLDMTPGEGLYYEDYLDAFNRDLVTEMVRRWGVAVQFLPNTASNGADMVAGRQADFAVNVRARWDGADRVDYSVPYHYTSGGIIVLAGSVLRSFNDFRGGYWIGTFRDSPQDKAYLESLGRTFSVYTFADSDDAYDKIFGSRDVDGLYADMIRLLAFVERYDDPAWRFVATGLGMNPFQPIALALPRNDADFATLVNWTLGDMRWDGTLERIYRAHYDVDQWARYGLVVPFWMPEYPGIGDFLNERGYD
jgi:ABC-type amino acid transport substrate-binding protein